MKFKVGDWASNGEHTGRIIEKLGFIFIEDDKTGEHIFIKSPIYHLSEDEVREYLNKKAVIKKKEIPKLRIRKDYEKFLTEYYRNGNIGNFLNQYTFDDEVPDDMKEEEFKTLKELREFIYSLGDMFETKQVITIQKLSNNNYLLIYWKS
jgi:hypothetical protein